MSLCKVCGGSGGTRCHLSSLPPPTQGGLLSWGSTGCTVGRPCPQPEPPSQGPPSELVPPALTGTAFQPGRHTRLPDTSSTSPQLPHKTASWVTFRGPRQHDRPDTPSSQPRLPGRQGPVPRVGSHNGHTVFEASFSKINPQQRRKPFPSRHGSGCGPRSLLSGSRSLRNVRPFVLDCSPGRRKTAASAPSSAPMP